MFWAQCVTSVRQLVALHCVLPHVLFRRRSCPTSTFASHSSTMLQGLASQSGTLTAAGGSTLVLLGHKLTWKSSSPSPCRNANDMFSMTGKHGGSWIVFHSHQKAWNRSDLSSHHTAMLCARLTSIVFLVTRTFVRVTVGLTTTHTHWNLTAANQGRNCWDHLLFVVQVGFSTLTRLVSTLWFPDRSMLVVVVWSGPLHGTTWWDRAKGIPTAVGSLLSQFPNIAWHQA